MRLTRLWLLRRRLSLLLTLLAALCVGAGPANAQNLRRARAKQRPRPATASRTARPAATANDGTPPGMVAFFMATQCPPGWVAPPNAQGRLILGVTDPSAVGVTANSALADQTAPTHAHTYTVTLPMHHKSISAADCCNNQGARAKDYTVTGTTAQATANLPFIQLPVCQKQ